MHKTVRRYQTKRLPMNTDARQSGLFGALASLPPQDRREIEDIAELEMRSLATTARMLCLKGLARYKAETEAATVDQPGEKT